MLTIRRLGALAVLFAVTAVAGPAGADEPSFEDWLEGFRAEAAAAGVRADIIETAFAGVLLNQRVFELNDNQPEFSRSIWDYLDSAVSERRISDGRARLAENAALLDRVEADFGVDKEIIGAIWGLESSYGRVMGDYDVIGALATLGWKGRRTGYGREQLIGALKILQNGYADREQLRGSWAGAMGQTQFIPTTYLSYAVDHGGDGKRNIWTDLDDVFASTANYLAVSRYERNAPWGVEVSLPEGFDYALADADTRKAVAEWAGAGVDGRRVNLVADFDPNRRGRIFLPAGARGPAFLVFENFEAILKYNRSTAYALAVGLLSDRLAGRDDPILAEWPRTDRALSLAERMALQQALKDKGFDPGPVDGVIGAGTKRALKAWQKSEGLPADGYASLDTLTRLSS
ncbi:MAG TPA: lytic murein transglycosylase [Parvularculaceae bacterium]|nr:lytic murein transglycosylase [Parvularculaceae bacterium]HNS85729.1 lytic murein transglycosylase [Parvularculaceae bacterium]